jgi:hypothetical protein
MKADSVFYGVMALRLWHGTIINGFYALLLNFGGLVLLPTNSSLDEQGNGDMHVHPH